MSSTAAILVGKRPDGPALYLRAVLYTNAHDWRRAEEALCQIARPPDTARFGFFVDDRYFQVQDLARLGLGRLAPARVGGCRPVVLTSFLPPDLWRIVYRRVLTMFGVPAEVLIASRATS